MEKIFIIGENKHQTNTNSVHGTLSNIYEKVGLRLHAHKWQVGTLLILYSSILRIQISVSSYEGAHPVREMSEKLYFNSTPHLASVGI